MPPIRIAVLSDDRLFSEGLVRILTTDPAIVIVGACADWTELATVASMVPDILVVDSRMTGAVDLNRNVNAGSTAIVYLATPNDDRWSLEALLAGARGILEKSAGPEELLKALHFVAEGQVWCSRPVLTECLSRLAAASRPPNQLRDEAIERLLSQRELEVFRHAATGLGNKELAERLAVSEATIKVHLTHIFHKLGLRGRGELAAAYHGILPRKADKSGSSTLRKPA